MVTEVTAEERQTALFEELLKRGSRGMTVVEAWEFGHELGFYDGGHGPETKRDLEELCKQRRGRVRKIDGFWRHAHEPDRIRLQYKRWADHWVAR